MGLQNLGFAAIVDLIGDINSIAAFTYIANGSTSTAHAAAQDELVSENTATSLARASVTPAASTTTVANDTIGWDKTWSATTSGTINEVGIFNAASTGTMLARSVTAATRTVASGDSYQAIYKIKAA